MKCPKCGYNSFDHLESCRKCGSDLTDHKSKYGLRSLLFPPRESPAEVPDEQTPAETAPEETADFGFDFMSEEPPAAPPETDLQDLLGDSAGEPFETDELSELSEEKLPDFDFGALEASFDEPPVDAEPEPAVSEEIPFDGTEEDDFPAEGGEESLDFDLNWEDESILPDLEEEPPFTIDSIPEVETPNGPEEDKSGKKKHAEMPEPKEPSDPFEQGGDADDGVSPDDEPFRTGDPRRLSGGDEEEPTDLAGTFFGSLGESDEVAPEHSDRILASPSFGEATLAVEDSGESLHRPTESSEPAEDGSIQNEPEPLEELDIAEAPPAPTAPIEADGTAPSEDAGELSRPLAQPALRDRAGAGATDLLILGLIFTLFLLAGQMALPSGQDSKLLPSLEMLSQLAIPYFLVLFAVFFGYFTLFHFLAGQTPGKMLFGLRVEAEGGSDLLLSQAFLRSVGGLISFLPAGLGYLRIIFDQEGRGWNDRLAGSRVVPVDTKFVRGEKAGRPGKDR